MQLIYFLTIINLFNYLDRYVLAAVLPNIRTHYGLSNQEAGWLVSAFVIGYVCTAPLFGVLSERFSKVKLMSFGVILWSIATIATAASESAMQLFIARIFIGIGEASFATIAPAYIKSLTRDVKDLNKSYGLFYAAIPVGAALGYAYAGSVINIIGWRYTFLYAGLPALALGIILYFIFNQIEVSKEAPQSNSNINLISAIRKLVSKKLFIAAVLGYIFNSLALNAVATFITSYGIMLGLSQEKISLYFGLILILAGFLGSIYGAKLCNRLTAESKNQAGSILMFVALISILATPFLSLAFLVSDSTTFLILCLIAELLIFAATPCLNSVIMLSVSEELESLAQGVTIFAINTFGALIASPLTGAAADRYGLSTAMQICSGSLLFGALIWLWAARRSLCPNK